jgi:hypothetical protein
MWSLALALVKLAGTAAVAGYDLATGRCGHHWHEWTPSLYACCACPTVREAMPASGRRCARPATAGQAA